MPDKDEIKIIGKNKCIWSSCIDCGKDRWVQIRGGTAKSKRCLSCAGKHRPLPVWSYFKQGKDNPMWKGGRRIDSMGYIRIKVPIDSIFYPMVHRSDGYVMEHRLVMAQHLGRCLTLKEVVHHIDRNRHNNELSNLKLMEKGSHYPVQHLVDRIRELEVEVAALKIRTR